MPKVSNCLPIINSARGIMCRFSVSHVKVMILEEHLYFSVQSYLQMFAVSVQGWV